MRHTFLFHSVYTMVALFCTASIYVTPPNRALHNSATIQNLSEHIVLITYMRTDPGFKGPHILVKDKKILHPQEQDSIIAYKGKKTTASAELSFKSDEKIITTKISFLHKALITLMNNDDDDTQTDTQK